VLTCSVSDLAQNSWAQAIRRAQPPEQLGLQACATAPGHRCPTFPSASKGKWCPQPLRMSAAGRPLPHGAAC
uniref:Uncharacterized protein n=1 Tax=Cairina moschata TaxID=8855 RepID=A0A8C3CNQ2_CAIMO